MNKKRFVITIGILTINLISLFIFIRYLDGVSIPQLFLLFGSTIMSLDNLFNKNKYYFFLGLISFIIGVYLSTSEMISKLN
jgi:hypothetical protein